MALPIETSTYLGSLYAAPDELEILLIQEMIAAAINDDVWPVTDEERRQSAQIDADAALEDAYGAEL